MTEVRLAGEHVEALIGDVPSKARTSAVQVAALVHQGDAPVRYASLQVQVLMPVPPPAARVSGVQTQVLVAWPWVVSTSDEYTAVQMLHDDGRWRPLYVPLGEGDASPPVG